VLTLNFERFPFIDRKTGAELTLDDVFEFNGTIVRQKKQMRDLVFQSPYGN
jgi:hypothetical protein